MPSAISIFTPETNAILLTLKFAAPSYKSKQSSDSLPGILAIESRKLQFSTPPLPPPKKKELKKRTHTNQTRIYTGYIPLKLKFKQLIYI
jgi:hypothetical protein